MSNLENANAKSAEERKRAEMHRTYGMWYTLAQPHFQ